MTSYKISFISIFSGKIVWPTYICTKYWRMKVFSALKLKPLTLSILVLCNIESACYSLQVGTLIRLCDCDVISKTCNYFRSVIPKRWIGRILLLCSQSKWMKRRLCRSSRSKHLVRQNKSKTTQIIISVR